MITRLFDIVIATVGLVVLSPLMLAVSLLVRITSPGPIFYRALRVGRNGETFRLYKFRSMSNTENSSGPKVTAAGDSRITGVGKILRKTKIDELPQLLNVLKGDMSIVGPRPEDPAYVAIYTPDQRNLLRFRPGITSPASITYRNEESLLTGENWETTYREKVLPEKLAIDQAYFNRRSLSGDMTIIFKTFLRLFQH